MAAGVLAEPPPAPALLGAAAVCLLWHSPRTTASCSPCGVALDCPAPWHAPSKWLVSRLVVRPRASSSRRRRRAADCSERRTCAVVNQQTLAAAAAPAAMRRSSPSTLARSASWGQMSLGRRQGGAAPLRRTARRRGMRELPAATRNSPPHHPRSSRSTSAEARSTGRKCATSLQFAQWCPSRACVRCLVATVACATPPVWSRSHSHAMRMRFQPHVAGC
jgi:hypothetical protein